MKIKVGDEVVILQGKDKGRTGKVEKSFFRKEEILVSGINIFKKHSKKRGNVRGGIIDITVPLPISKVALVCPKCKLPTKVAFSLVDKQKVRVCKKCKQLI
ncbi:MAG: 50S ribosomal protein L24 [Candidatus Woykebacteria bacterium RBG_13_40_15]|uniref:Large ribosomal subunit protein uL24 n=1 Tax=Candidatus Woykebacteria bacterium RBG_13_40_15 TaxID=1802593 RepID=A0A1G1W947_9BACT|nr:MAG: 50S ribosomal protein L24 [Candidatus Woykebacteria bacterium RBG_13_40_15]